MALPTTNLTAHFDASTSAKVFNTGASPATDGQLVERWADAEGKDLAYWYVTDTTREPTYRTTAVLMQAACLDFDGLTDYMGMYNNAGSVSKTLADVLGASAKTILISFYVEDCPDVGVVPVYQYDPIIGDASQYFGIFISNNSGVYKLNAYNYDGTADTIQVTISLNTSYVVMLRHNGTNLYMSVDGGAESSTASGATQVTTGQMRLGYVVSTGIFSGRIGEVAVYNVDLSTQSTDLATAISYFTTKWKSSDITVSLSSAVANARAGTASGPYDPTVLLPAVYYDTTYTTPTGTTIVVGDGGNFQTALNTANLGDVITLSAGSTYTATTFTLPAGKTGSGYLVIRSSATLTTEGVRITTAQAAAFPKITTNGTTPAIQAAASSSYYRFINCEFTSSSIAVNGGLVQLGSGAENNLTLFPHHIILDRCYIHGDATNGGRRGVMFSGNYQAIIDSYVSDWKEVGADTQAIAGWTGEGPYKVVNNYVEGAGENILFGGSDTQIANLIPADIEITDNYFFKPLSWKIGHPSHVGVPDWDIKNSFELKNCKRVLIENNLIENNWADGQVGFAVLFTVRNQQTTNPWATVQDVTFRNNELKNSDNGINLMGWDTESGIPSDYARRCLISDNLLTNIGGQWFGDGILFQIGVGYEDVTIDHNTLLFDPAVPGTGTTISAYSYACPRFQFTNNICQHGQYGIVGDGTNPGNPSIAQHFPSSTITKNVFQTPAGWGPATLPDAGDGQWYPVGNYFPHALESSTVSEVGFANYPTDLSLSLSSPYHNAAIDGTDIGAILAAAPTTFNPVWAASSNQLIV